MHHFAFVLYDVFARTLGACNASHRAGRVGVSNLKWIEQQQGNQPVPNLVKWEENCKGTNDKCTAGQYNGCSCIDGDKVPLVYTRALGERGEDTGYLTEYPGTLAELDQQQKVLAEMERLANGDEDEDEDCDEDDE
ncbi:uncharacterized protein PFLUO_LOCUS5884 [Penicillium psychrofluorescens]|uniref:uncharacterized protein n=1 Tax=Penicillium psychrofluorescens TaxID=3158075 RepID=UPI003CCCB339